MATNAINKSIFRLIIVSSLFITPLFALNPRYIVELINAANCKKANTDPTHEYFDISKLTCLPCSQGRQFQTQSSDGLSCVCQPGYYLTENFGGGKITCQACPANQVTSADQWSCVDCTTSNPINAATNRCQTCAATGIAVERYRNGTRITNAGANPVQSCETCIAKTSPDAGKTSCARCSQLLSMIPTSANCDCPPKQFTGGLCFSSDAYLPLDSGSSLYTVPSTDGTNYPSAYFEENIRAAIGICNPAKYGNLTACQLLGNLCTLLYSTRVNFGRSNGDACSEFDGLKDRLVGNAGDWPASMPWLYYSEQGADVTITETLIKTQFTFSNDPLTGFLNFRAAAYSLNGTYLGLKNVTDGRLQLCKNSINEMNSAYRFGTYYSSSCDLSADELWDRSEEQLVFYDLYLQYQKENGRTSLFPIPVKVQNLQTGNTGTDPKGWQLTRRIFLVDNISTRTKDTGSSNNPNTPSSAKVAALLRYASRITIYVQLQDGVQTGEIYPPYVEVQYSELKSNVYGTGRTVQVSFQVVYKVDTTRFEYELSVAMGVLCCLGAIYAFLRTWGWSRRSGKVTVDFLTIVKVFFFGCGAIANVFFIVTFGAAFWFIIFYKRQSIVYLFIPTRDQELPFVAYLSVAFGLKCLDVIHLFASQCTVDIFFIDWERPKGRIVVKQEEGGEKKTEENPVSIWRTYMVANEWNEIQTTRKIHPMFQLFCVVFFLKVVGFENLATADPYSDFTPDDGTYHSPHSRIFRYAIATCVYLIVAVVQYGFFTFIYERFIDDNIQQYVDLCSVSNVSVFIMANSQYGYYIHGRSVHGTADTGMKEMYEALKREEADLCGHRGLLPNNDQQTFQMALPKRLRTYYDRALMPVREINAAGSAASKMEKGQPGGMANAAVEKSMQAYQNVTKFLSAFIDHSLKDIDYFIKDKMLMENILDLEFEDSTEKGTFYNDDGHSFDSVLFYGNEATLLVFNILMFVIVDMIAMDFILAAVITFIFDEILVLIRDNLGRRNLAKKTLVDQRFLI